MEKNQHSQNIAQNGRIFIVVYDSQAPLGQGEGLYFRMHAKVLETDEEIAKAQKIYDVDFFKHPFAHTHFLGDCPQRIYRAVPDEIWHNTDGNEQGHFVDKREALLTAE